MAIMVPSLRHRRIVQSANMLCDKSMTLKLEIFFLLFISYFKARRIIDMLSLCLLVADERNPCTSSA
jgi:hypothetical protein